MIIDLDQLHDLITERTYEIEEAVAGTGYLVRTVVGVGTFLLDHDGDINLLTSKQQATFERFLKPLLDEASR